MYCGEHESTVRSGLNSYFLADCLCYFGSVPQSVLVSLAIMKYD